MRALAAAATRLWLDLTLEGLEHLPERGPALIAARHFHHLYDGAILISRLPRPVRVVVAADWAKDARWRALLELGCGLLGWPTVLRRDALACRARPAYRPDEVLPYLQRALREVALLLRNGEVVAIFPEGYPTIDPEWRMKKDDTVILPFRPGFLRFAQYAERTGAGAVPIIPAGIWAAPPTYRRIVLRLGAPRFASEAAEATLIREIEDAVRALSRPPDDGALRDPVS
ncbi:MAG: lysophospholipid acyltransferase family protein [Chloroflexota bacterium]|nr:1-acyl-sn-glycerol-3-phosphate acyltransferase [Dehalococcoidia bacterium]MDW8254507.1 lysophospholipid acyltransferase family protein [Chloroflexota bacterium]